MYLSSLTKEPMAEQLSVSGEKITDSSAHKGSRNLRRSRDRGFSLVEVLVVMLIIATLLGIGVGAIKNMASSKGVDTAVPLADSVFVQARQVAKSTGVPTRVVVYADSTGDKADIRERYHRMIGIATARGANGRPVQNGETIAEWRLVSRPITLPRNTFFNTKYSETSGEGTAVFPGNGSARCYVYQFNSEGALVGIDNSRLQGGGQFVVQAGKLIPRDPPELKMVSNGKRDVGGFKIWESGRMAKFRSPNQIIEGSGDAEFE